MTGSASQTGEHPARLKIMVADDDAPTRMMLRAAISQWQYETVEAGNGEEAWEILQAPEAPNLLIVDWLMPKLDGLALCERIRHDPLLHEDTFVILLTQLTGTTNVTRALEAGADEFLTKPFNMAELRSRLLVGERVITLVQTLAARKLACQKTATQLLDIAGTLQGVAGSLRATESHQAVGKIEHAATGLRTVAGEMTASGS